MTDNTNTNEEQCPHTNTTTRKAFNSAAGGVVETRHCDECGHVIFRSDSSQPSQSSN